MYQMKINNININNVLKIKIMKLLMINYTLHWNSINTIGKTLTSNVGNNRKQLNHNNYSIIESNSHLIALVTAEEYKVVKYIYSLLRTLNNEHNLIHNNLITMLCLCLIQSILYVYN